MVQQMVTDPNIMFLNVFHKFKPTFSERTWFWLIFGFVGPRQSLDFPRQSLGFPRQSLGFPRVDHAGTTQPSRFFFRCAPNVSNLWQAIWPKVVLNTNHWHYASTQGMSSIMLFRNCYNKMRLLAEPPCVAKTWQYQWVARREKTWTNIVSLNNHGNPSESRSDLISCHLPSGKLT